jgi:hypothetical protein
MNTTPQFEKREYAVLFTLFQSEKYLKEFKTLRDSLPDILKNHKVNIITKSQPYEDGFLIFLYVLLRETEYLSPAQSTVEMDRFLVYVEGLIGERLTTDPKLCDGVYNLPKFT